jgi:lantibiotic modifying enzyme
MRGHSLLTSVVERGLPLLSEPLLVRAREIANVIADRLADPNVPHRVFESSRANAGFLRNVGFDPRGLAAGNAGIAMMFGALATADARRHAAADAHLRAAVAVTPLAAGPSLFGGTTGLLVAARTAARGVHYAHLIEQLEAVVDRLAGEVAEQLAEGVERDSQYDLMSGASGTLVGARRPAARERLAQALAALAIDPAGSGWRARSRFGTTETEGNNLGLAHGSAGMIASLARCADVEGVAPAVSTLADYTLAHCAMRDGAAVDVPPFVDADGHATRRGRGAWCYGAPGNAVALLAADRAFGLPHARQCASELLEHVARRSDAELGIQDDGLCHGRAGVALALAVGASALDSDTLLSRSSEMFATIIDRFDPAFPLGYRSSTPDGALYDDPGLLTGSPGIALALLVAARDIDAACLSPFHLDWPMPPATPATFERI